MPVPANLPIASASVGGLRLLLAGAGCLLAGLLAGGLLELSLQERRFLVDDSAGLFRLGIRARIRMAVVE